MPRTIDSERPRSKSYTECWRWVMAKSTAGYGQVRFNGKAVYVHRLFYEAFKGKIPRGLTIDHLCRQRDCFNPKHLEAVSNKENIRRGFKARELLKCQ